MADRFLNKAGLTQLWSRIKADRAQALAPLFEAEGYGPASLASFDAGYGGLPLKSCVAEIKAAQPGSGDPSPSNIRPIYGSTGVIVAASGKNLLYNGLRTAEDGTLTVNADGSVTINGSTDIGNISSGFIGFTAGQVDYKSWIPKGTYHASIGTSVSFARLQICCYDDSGTGSITILAHGTDFDFTVTDEMQYVYARLRIYDTTSKFTFYPMITRIADAGTAFEPFKGKVCDISFPSEAGTVYGGTLDVLKGTLTVDRGAFDLGALNWVAAPESTYQRFYTTGAPFAQKPASQATTANIICTQYATASWTALSSKNLAVAVNTSGAINVTDSRYSTAAAFKSAMSGVRIVCELASPVTYQLAPEIISTLLGANNIWCGAGDVTVEYGAFLQALQQEIETLGR